MQLRGTKIVVDSVSAKQPVISISGLASGTARTLNERESGSVALFDAVEGGTFTLPATPTPGTYFDFKVSRSITANSAKVITGLNGSTLSVICGGLDVINVNDYTEDGFQIVEGATTNRFVAVTMNGTTTGGQVGTDFRATALSNGTWLVTGLVFGSGAMATPVATS